MGGFRVNGCGVTDHFKKIKSLGLHMCPICKRASEFFLEEAKQKIDIIFIPTVTLKSRYVVMCGRCEQGEICSDQWAVNLMNGKVPDSIIFESEAQKQVPPSEEQKNLPPAPVPKPVQPPTPQPPVVQETAGKTRFTGGSGIPSFFKCAYCGVTQMREGDFCSYCGKPAPEDPNGKKQPEPIVVTPSAPNICPSCGSEQPSDNKFCSTCGQPLIRKEQSLERVCPGCGTKVTGSESFCMECGKKL